MTKKATKRITTDQIEQFKNVAKSLDCDDSEFAFDKTLGLIGRAKPLAKSEPKNKKKALKP